MNALLLALRTSPGDFRQSPYGGMWDDIATKIRKRDKFICRRCKKRGWIVHHRISIQSVADKSRWTFWVYHLPWNLVTICNDCHEDIHGRDFNHDGTIG